jgi:LmbE family N-acetylglucosaminyl deacetylase
MKKIIFGIFAHPDDEALSGPGGALIEEVENGAELHLITFTDGDGGTNPDDLPNLGEVRLREWRKAGELIGATSMHHLGYEDGYLNNQVLLEATEKITQLVMATIKDESHSTQIEFMSMDLNGITGHIDHIVATRTACLVFYHMKELDSRFTRIRLACYPQKAYPKINTDWLFMEAGRKPEEIDETIDARGHKDKLIQLARLHHTQRQDGEKFLAWQGDELGMCYFIVKS